MPSVMMRAILPPAAAAGRGVGAFNVIGIEHAEAIISGAEQARAPVVLQLSENCLRYHGRPEPIVRAVLAAAAGAAVPACVHLDHATDEELLRDAVRLGVRSVMYDASQLAYEQNVKATAGIARWCHERTVWVEAELGEIGGKDGVHAPGARTRPDQAAAYVAETGVDALAVAVGSSHAMLTRDAVLDLDLISRLREAAGVPLVLHGSSGVPDQMISAAVRAGLTKVNLATQLNKVFTAAVRSCLAVQPAMVDPRHYLAAGRDAVADEVARLLRLLTGAAG